MKKTSQQEKRISKIFHIVMFAYLVACFFIMNAIYSNYYESEKNNIIDYAESTKLFINTKDIKTLNVDLSDIENESYQFLKTNLVDLKQSRNNIEFAYLMKKIDNRIYFLVDSEDPDSKDYSYPGQLYFEATPNDFEPFLSKQTVVTDEISDRWGTWISVLVPIVDGNEVVAVLGLDYDAVSFKQNILNQTLNYFYVFISIFVLIIVYYWIAKKNIELQKLSNQLKESEGLFKAIFEQSPIGIATISTNSQTTRVNPAYVNIISRTNQDIVGNDWRSMTYPTDLEKEEVLFKSFLKGEISEYEIEKRLMTRLGDTFWVKTGISSLDLNDSDEFNYLCMVEDISERKKVSDALQESERSKSVLLSHIPGLAYRCLNDEHWTMEFVSDGCLDLTGYKPIDLIGNNTISYNEIIDPQYRDVLRKQWDQVLLKHENFRAEYQIITKDNQVKWVLELAQGIYDHKGNVIALEGIIIDITQTKLRDAQIRYMDDHDFLTGLFNRKYFEIEKIRFNQQSYLPLSVLIGDINGVRLINDAYGYTEGDRLIVETARILKSSCDSSSLLFRTGGDEFIVLMPNTSESKLSDIMRRIQHKCKLYNLNPENQAVQLNLSLGSATRVHMTQAIDKVIHQAMDSLHKNKILESKSYHSSILS